MLTPITKTPGTVVGTPKTSKNPGVAWNPLTMPVTIFIRIFMCESEILLPVSKPYWNAAMASKKHIMRDLECSLKSFAEELKRLVREECIRERWKRHENLKCMMPAVRKE